MAEAKTKKQTSTVRSSKPTPPAKKAPSKKVAVSERYMSYAEAREFIQQEFIPSKAKFEEWWLLNKPAQIPRFPYRAYGKDWVSWNDFLGTNNTFRQRRAVPWRPLEDAIQYIHGLKLKSYNEWMQYVRQEPCPLPEDIPQRPDMCYRKWRSWNHWLGVKAEVEQNIQLHVRSKVFCIMHNPNSPQNVFHIGVENGGLPAVKMRWMREQFEIVKLFWVDPTTFDIARQVVDMYSYPYQGDEQERVSPNIWEIISRLEQHLFSVTPKQAAESDKHTIDPLDIS